MRVTAAALSTGLVVGGLGAPLGTSPPRPARRIPVWSTTRCWARARWATSSAADALGIGVHRAVPGLLGRRAGVQQLGGHRLAGGVQRPGPGVVQQRCHPDDSHRPDPLRQAGGGRVRHRRRRGPAFHRVVDRTVGCSGLTTAMHLDNGATQVWSFDGGRRPPPTRPGPNRKPAPIGAASPRPAARKRVAAGQGVPVRQRRSGGECAGRAMQNTLGQ
ncbi:hypothetical protein I553_2883 [Mycobacterium xenopi 4042]|uniref:Uncharacterized protein n=1 Tax=Mycobacterium xenopi 4042 TaxID=1299334 RepID=X8EF07_MYCXE|nr:hypothetical protein I553_2883 [Mycobacterium xenopi 4042]